jgi:hypothetical protein
MLKRLWRALFARKPGVLMPNGRVLLDRIAANEPGYANAMWHLKKFDLPEEELRRPSSTRGPRRSGKW